MLTAQLYDMPGACRMPKRGCLACRHERTLELRRCLALSLPYCGDDSNRMFGSELQAIANQTLDVVLVKTEPPAP